MKRNPRETDEEFLERVARVRGAMEDQFWRQASSLKADVDSLHPKTISDHSRVKSARTALKRANLAYLDDHLELALAYQTKAMNLLVRIKDKGAKP